MYKTRDQIDRLYRPDAERYQSLRDSGLRPQDALIRLLIEGAGDVNRLHGVRIAERLSLREAKAFKVTTEAWRCGRISTEQYQDERRRAIETDPKLAGLMD